MDFNYSLTGFFVGTIVGLTGVGGGSLMTPLLVLLFGISPVIAQMATTKVVGSDIAHAVPLTLVAGLGHASLGNVDWTLLVSLLIGSLPGVVIGSLLTSRLPEKLIRSILVTLLVAVGGRLVWVE